CALQKYGQLVATPRKTLSETAPASTQFSGATAHTTARLFRVSRDFPAFCDGWARGGTTTLNSRCAGPLSAPASYRITPNGRHARAGTHHWRGPCRQRSGVAARAARA